jgi:hypothetical protein
LTHSVEVALLKSLDTGFLGLDKGDRLNEAIAKPSILIVCFWILFFNPTYITNFQYILIMFSRSLTLAFIVPLLSYSVIAQEAKYDFPGNKNLPRNRFIPASVAWPGADHSVIGVSARMVPWSEYLGSKQETRSVSPDRMVYELLTVYCGVTPKGERKYYFQAVDAQTRKHLGKRKFGYTKSLISVSPISKKYGQKEESFRCGYMP